jgi:hypothetical protein
LNLRKINELLNDKDQKDTQSAILIPEHKDDSDIVYELEYSSRFKLFRKKHEIFDSHEGWCILKCHKSKRRFLHLIRVPNKFALFCRVCHQEV